MDRDSALEKLRRVVAAVDRGEAPYVVLEIAVYGSVARGEEKVNDLDLYLELERKSVPVEHILGDAKPSWGPGALKRLRKVLKKSPQERIDITYGFNPWETHRREAFAKPEDIDRRTDEELARFSPPDGELPKRWKDHMARLERQREKVKAKGYEWPVPGIIVYRARGAPDASVGELLNR